MRFLFFLYFLPPAPGTAPLRNGRIARAIASRVPGSIAFTARYPGRPPAPIEGLEIRDRAVFDYRTLLRKRTEDGYLPEHTKTASWKQWLVRLINTFPFNILMGEGGLWYVLRLILSGRALIRSGQVTHVYSSFRPFADHYAAYWLKRLYPHVYWVADFRDLIVDPHSGHILFPAVQQRIYTSIFRRANLLTTVSDGLAKHLRKYNPNVLTLRNGIDGEIRVPAPGRTAFFTVVYTGSMFLDQRNPGPLFASIRSLIREDAIDPHDIRILYAGKDGAEWRELAKDYGLEDLLLVKGIIPQAEALKIQRDACINVLLTASSDSLQGVLTGKMIEYFQAGSPVLAVIAGQNDPELSSMLSTLKIGQAFSDQPEDLEVTRRFILEEYLSWKRSGMNRKPVDPEVLRASYSTSATMKPLFDQLGLT